MTDLYQVEVVSRKSKKVRVRLHMTLQTTSVSIGPSFARMLIEEEARPGHEAYRAWLRKKYEQDEDFDTQSAIARVEVVAFTGLPREPWAQPDPGGSPGVVDLEVSVDDPGMLDHLEPGIRWGSTAFDELGDGTIFTGRTEEERVWKRPAAAPRVVEPSSGIRVMEQSRDGLLLEVWTTGELPATTPAVWLELLRFPFPELEKVRADQVGLHIAAVTVELIDGARDPVRGKVSLAKDMSLRVVGALRAHYRLHPASATWLEGAPRVSIWLESWAPERVLSRPPLPSAGGDVVAFTELLELAREEGVDSEVGMLADGLDGSRDVVLEALRGVRALGERAAPLANKVAAWIECADDEIAVAALDAAGEVRASSLGQHVALAARRKATHVAEAATWALARLPERPAWSA